jgi:hypothetical protein
LISEVPAKRAGEIPGKSDPGMRRMLCVALRAARALLRFDNLVWMGADEMNEP